jgi:hypothetical protein
MTPKEMAAWICGEWPTEAEIEAKLNTFLEESVGKYRELLEDLQKTLKAARDPLSIIAKSVSDAIAMTFDDK